MKQFYFRFRLSRAIRFFLVIVLLSSIFNSEASAQNVGIGTTSPNASAQLDITSNSKGLLIPRLTTTQRGAIVSPAKGLIVYDSTSQVIFYYDGAVWQGVSNSGNAWSLNGNSGSNPASQFIGTIDN